MRIALRTLIPLGLFGAWIAGCAGERPNTLVPAGEPLVLPEYYAHSIAALGFPGARRAFQVGHGSVVGSGEAALRFARLGAEPVRISPVYFERDGVPVAHWWMVSATDSTHFEAAAFQHRLLGDTSLVLVVRATTTRLAADPGEAGLEVRIVSRPEGPSFAPWDLPDDTSFAESWQGGLALRDGRVVAGLGRGVEPATGVLSRDGPPPGPSTSRLMAHARIGLAPGERRAWEFWLPAYPIPPAIAKRLAAKISFEEIASGARRAWREWLGRAAPFSTPDSLINAAYRASLVTLIQCHERSGDDWVPIGNPFQYRDMWLRDGAQAVRALAIAGLTELARADAWTMRRYQFPGGAFLSQQGQLDGTGQAIWALAQAASCPPDPAWARRALPHAARGLRWIERQRALGRELKLPWAGLLPYADPRDNELARAQLTGNDAWAYTGVRATALLARLAGDRALESEALAAAADYRRAFLAALARGRFRDVPASWQGVGRDWGNLTVGFPARILAVDDPRIAALAQRVWSPAGGPGLAVLGSSDSLHTYFAGDLAEWALLAGRAADARAVLTDLIAHGSSTLGYSEFFSRRDRGFGPNLPPHVTAAAKLVQLVRDMALSDTRDTLEIALGGSLDWWQGTRLERAPTRFGVLDLDLARPATDRLRAHWSRVSVPARIRVPDGVVAVGVSSPGARLVAGRWIECPAGAIEAEFSIELARRAEAASTSTARAVSSAPGGTP